MRIKEGWVDVTEHLGGRKSGVFRPTKVAYSDTPITMTELRTIFSDEDIIKLARAKEARSDSKVFWERGKVYCQNKVVCVSGFAPKDLVKERLDSPVPAPLKEPTQKWLDEKPLHTPVRSSNPKKKGMVYVTKNGSKRLIHFGDASMEDYTIHRDKDRRRSYLARAGGITDGHGNLTAKNKNSANYYSIHYLW